MREIQASEVVRLLKSGYMRWTKDEMEPGRSIQTHYNLSFSQCKEVFNHPEIKGVKTKVQTIRVIGSSEAPATVNVPQATTQTATTAVEAPRRRRRGQVNVEIIEATNQQPAVETQPAPTAEAPQQTEDLNALDRAAREIAEIFR